ncbi:MAG TPA: glycosyltransferase [Candidatus Eisenbacteria bacterium]|nr:glycosyltransferase [Candidatus Eisenbacteria bacterium]
MKKGACRVIVLNYNGRDLLAECLPSIVEAAKAAKHPTGVTVLDNRSKDDSETLVREKFPTVAWVESPANRVYFSFNACVAALEEEFVILLNNDIRVEPGFVDPLLEALERHEDAFFAAPRSLDWNGAYEGSLSKMEFRRGLLWGSSRFPGHESKIRREGITMQCGFGAFRRERFTELGGYDDLYFPGTMEDSDLCFRGWRRGWKGYYCPESVVHHIGQATFKKAFGASGIRRMNRRNLYLFVWKNIRDPLCLAAHALWIPVHLVKYAVKGETDFLGGFFDACGLFGRAMDRRRATRGPRVLTDRRIFETSRSI